MLVSSSLMSFELIWSRGTSLAPDFKREGQGTAILLTGAGETFRATREVTFMFAFTVCYHRVRNVSQLLLYAIAGLGRCTYFICDLTGWTTRNIVSHPSIRTDQHYYLKHTHITRLKVASRIIAFERLFTGVST